MPAYLGSTRPNYVTACVKGDVVNVWAAEQPVAGNGGLSASMPVALPSIKGEPGTPFSASGEFSGAPGAFEIDVQGAENDVEAQYQTLPNGNITTVDSTNNTFVFEGIQVNCKFVRLLMRSRTNAVNVNGRIQR